MGDDGAISRVCRYNELSQREIHDIFYEEPSGNYQSLFSWFPDSSPSSTSVSTSTKSKRVSKRDSKRDSNGKDSEKKAKDTSSLMEKEDRQIGFVPPKVYIWFIRSGGIHYMIGLAIISFIGRTVKVSSSFYLSYWGGVNADAEATGSPLSEERNLTYLNNYAIIVVSNDSILSKCQSFTVYVLAL